MAEYEYGVTRSHCDPSVWWPDLTGFDGETAARDCIREDFLNPEDFKVVRRLIPQWEDFDGDR